MTETNAYWLRRHRQVAANVHGDGDWTHELKGAWGLVRLAAAKRFREIHVGDEYVPEVGRWVKSVEETYTSNGVRSNRYTMELESYKRAQ